MRILLFACAALVCASCGEQKAKKASGTDGAGTTNAAAVYTMPQIPPLISDPDARADWAVKHYWDDFDFADTTLVGSRAAYTEQAFADYINQVLAHVPYEMGDESIAIMFRKASPMKEMFTYIAELGEKYLFDPNSPYMNSEYYISVLNAVLANPSLDEYERLRPEEQLKLSLKNRVGTRALDFRYTLASGASGTLYGLRSPYTLLYFNNPGCPSCRQTQEQLMSSSYLMRLVEEGKLAILAIYPDADLSEWRDHAKDFPANWINSYDKTVTIKTDELYDLKAIPTLYLLDASKTVMLKDVMSVPYIEDTLYNALEQ